MEMMERIKRGENDKTWENIPKGLVYGFYFQIEVKLNTVNHASVHFLRCKPPPFTETFQEAFSTTAFSISRLNLFVSFRIIKLAGYCNFCDPYICFQSYRVE